MKVPLVLIKKNSNKSCHQSENTAVNVYVKNGEIFRSGSDFRLFYHQKTHIRTHGNVV